MPEPIFRHSDGEPVKPSEPEGLDPEPDTLDPGFSAGPEVEPEPETPAPAEQTTAAPDDPLAKLYAPPDVVVGDQESPTHAPPVPVAAVEPQPYISEQFTAEKIVVETAPATKKRSGCSTLSVMGLLILLGVAGGVAAVVYYFYFAGRAGPNPFQ